MSYSKDECRAFVAAYLSAALWAETVPPAHENDDEGGSFEFHNFGPNDIAPLAKRAAIRDCLLFIGTNDLLLLKAGMPEENGYDFWLTRQHHGAGFWDRGYGKAGLALTEAAQVYSSLNLHIGADDMIHGFGEK